MPTRKIFISGYAKLPKGITATELYSVIAVGLLVNAHTGEILDADCTLVTSVAKNFFKNSVIGENLNNIDAIERIFTENYYGSARKAIISALRTCAEKYKQVIVEGKIEEEHE
ncbi:DUF3870 domain-containing protein [Thermotalea metallivorans]|uniref:DUF3870 domain-containing protein n=1 Tax=Thermotalea metallivorans TaxID=520762 RepID=A0A140L097_9FIRM|nr:DUF3870 domain-containing protein [Thermotalea metallivorans]KXG73972.1 hypothetical protein AN619_27290 [Thermotalea metallivorans]